MEHKELYTAEELEDLFLQYNAEFAAKIVKPLPVKEQGCAEPTPEPTSIEVSVNAGSAEVNIVSEPIKEKPIVDLEPPKRPISLIYKIEETAKDALIGSCGVAILGTAAYVTSIVIQNPEFENLTYLVARSGLAGAALSAVTLAVCNISKAVRSK